ncbi:MAG: rod shape-determining protein MreC [Gemmatimonadota bacterium]|nr:rod shape-determining protein MreC [Gemmatimonadota bacterium]MDP6528143.1 rod shape-determining protein MreC [Gemmatimonadota bacterium]
MSPLNDYLSRRGEILVLVCVVAASLTLHWVSRSRGAGFAHSLHDAALGPVQSGLSFVGGLVGLRSENDSLRTDLAQASLRIAALREDAREGDRLREMLALRDRSTHGLLAARVVAVEADRTGDDLRIDKGERDGVRRNLAVVTPSGLAGAVATVGPRTSLVRPLAGPQCQVSVRLSGVRAEGILRWDRFDGLRVTFLPARAAVEVGEEVITTGYGGVFPAGIPVGRVRSVESSPGDGTLRVSVEPAVDFSRLEEVFVVSGSGEETP